MIFEKFIDTDLSDVSYIVGCDGSGEDFIVDPRRDIKEYVDFIEKNELTLKYVFNTHTHANYIGGHIEPASKYDVDNIFQNSAPIIQPSLSNIKEVNFSQYDKLIISCNYGYKSSTISSLLKIKNIYFKDCK